MRSFLLSRKSGDHGDILNSLRTTGKTLCVVGDGYTLQVSGKDVRNTTGELNTSLDVQQVEQGLEFVVNDGKTVPLLGPH